MSDPYRTLLSRLDTEQKHVVAWRPSDGNLRIQATAGSGKTTTLTALAATLIREAAWPAAQMVITTFSRKAADEIAGRINDTIGPSNIQMSTWHGLALKTMRSLQPSGWKFNRCVELPIGSRATDVPSSRQIWRDVTSYRYLKVLSRQGLDVETQTNAFMDQRMLDMAEGRQIADGGRRADPALYLTAWQMYKDYKAKLGVWDWDDLLYAWLKRLQANERKHPLLVLVDEAQDNSRVQLEIAQRLASHENGRLILVGDSRQAIHTWRGAYPELFIEAEKHLGAITRYLHNTYRCPTKIVEMANALVANEVWADGPAAGATRDVAGRTTFRRECVVGEVASRTRHQGDPNDFAILARTNAEVGRVVIQLLAKGINARALGGGNILKSPIARDLIAWLEVADTDHSALTADGWMRVYRTPTRYLRKEWAQTVWKRTQSGMTLLQAIDATPTRASGYHALYREIKALQKMEPAEGLNRLQTQLTHISRVLFKLETIKSLAASSKNRRCNEERSRDDRIAKALIDLAGTFTTLAEFKALQELSENRGEPAVTVSTMHRSKGLEWPIVYVMAEAKKVPLKNGDPDEEKRLFYVAITRAKEELHCLFETGPSEYIADYLGENDHGE